MVDLLELARQNDSNLNLVQHGFKGDPGKLYTIDSSDLATSGQVSGLNTGRFITAILVVMLFTGGSVTALDSVAGEKERGTLETLLTTAAGRSEIVLAKQTAISTVAIAITLIQALNFLVYFKLKGIPLPANFTLDLSAVNVISLFALFIPLSIAVGSVLLLLSAHAKSFREAQLYFFPVYLIGLILALASLLPGIPFRSAIVLVPIANISVAAREILVGRGDTLMLAITFLVMAMFAGWLLRLSLRVLLSENIVLPALAEPAEFTGGRQLFEKRVTRWFVVMWVVQFAAAVNPQLASLRRQIVFNELIVMLGASIVMIRLYKLDIRQTLSLKPVKPAVWAATLLAIPCANVVGTAVYRLMNFFIPVSKEVLRSFSEEIIPKDMPQWQLFLFVAVLPAICEEIAFRGLLLSGLKRRLRPIGLVVTVGLAFGIFHMTLFRIFPTAVLGVFLTAIAVLTGSILPGIVLHMGNNAWSVWSGLHDFNPDQLGFWPSSAMVGVFALCLWIIYRNRVRGGTN
jgi:sodium transport system permease protein